MVDVATSASDKSPDDCTAKRRVERERGKEDQEKRSAMEEWWRQKGGWREAGDSKRMEKRKIERKKRVKQKMAVCAWSAPSIVVRRLGSSSRAFLPPFTT